MQASPPHGCPQALPPDAVALAAQGDLESTGAIAAFMPAKYLHQGLFPGRGTFALLPVVELVATHNAR